MKSGKGLPIALIVIAILIVLGTVGALFYADYMQGKKLNNIKENSYGVFTGIKPEDMKKLEPYKTVVIEGQDFTTEDIKQLKEEGKTVYSYLNIGGIETTRSYFSKYDDLCLGFDETMTDEFYVDVTNFDWQEFIVAMATDIAMKGVDGFLVDNCGVYDYCVSLGDTSRIESGAIRDGLTEIIKGVRSTGKRIIVHGGEMYVNYCLNNEKRFKDYVAGVSREQMLTKYDYENQTYSYVKENKKAMDYLEKCRSEGLKVYCLEYASKSDIVEKISKFYESKGYPYYIAPSIELK